MHDDAVVGIGDHLDAGHALGLAALEVLGEPQDAGEQPQALEVAGLEQRRS
jgi:hypothetical protein